MKKCFVFFAWFLLTVVNPVVSSELTVLTENLPPLNFVKNNDLIGPSVEIVKEIQKRVESNEEIQVYPWSRAYKKILKDENVVLFGMTHTEERHNKFKWVGPIASKRDILVCGSFPEQFEVLKEDSDLTAEVGYFPAFDLIG